MIRFRNWEVLKANAASAGLRRLRLDALDILSSALESVEPGRAVRDRLSLHDSALSLGEVSISLPEESRVFVVGGGKAGAAMAEAVEDILGDRVTGGVMNVPAGGPLPTLNRIRFVEADHPIPGESGVRGVEEMLGLLRDVQRSDTVICLISGGGSALMPLPAEGVSLKDVQDVTGLLLRGGADIRELNAVRKHLDAFKGGQLAKAACPATLLTLIMSDVVGDPLDVIASGPTVPDTSSFTDARAVLEKYGVWERCPRSVRERITGGVEGRIPETPKPGDQAFERCFNEVIASNSTAVSAAAKRAEKLGYRTSVLTTSLEGEAREAGLYLSKVAAEEARGSTAPEPPCALIAGGETTVRVTGGGRGGRNQEVALSAVRGISGSPCVLAAFATDGVDGPTDSAGAIADGDTWERARRAGVDPATFLADNNSYAFWSRLGDNLFTGPTGTNVCDISLILLGGRDVD